MKKVMLRAWEIVRTLVGDLRARLSVALKQAWSEFKEEENELFVCAVGELVEETLQDRYPQLRESISFEGDTEIRSYYSTIYKKSRWKSVRETVLAAKIVLHADGRIVVEKDRARMLDEVFKGKKVFGVSTAEERKNKRLKDMEEKIEYANYRELFIGD